MKVVVFLLALEQAADPAVAAKKAKALGFASFWIPEHSILSLYYTPHYAVWPDRRIPAAVGIIADSFVTLARASAATSTIQLGNGWLPTRASLEAIKRGRAAFNELVEKAGRVLSH